MGSLTSLKGDRAFQRLRKGRAGHGRLLSLRWLESKESGVRVGIVVSRKIGKAVTRNRVRRRLREALRLMVAAGEVKTNADVIVIARPEAATADYGELKAALKHALKKAKLS